jgi:hypothetical protein
MQKHLDALNKKFNNFKDGVPFHEVQNHLIGTGYVRGDSEIAGNGTAYSWTHFHHPDGDIAIKHVAQRKDFKSTKAYGAMLVKSNIKEENEPVEPAPTDKKQKIEKTAIGTPADEILINPPAGEDPASISSVGESVMEKVQRFVKKRQTNKKVNEAFEDHFLTGDPRQHPVIENPRGRLSQATLNSWIARMKRREIQLKIIDNP